MLPQINKRQKLPISFDLIPEHALSVFLSPILPKKDKISTLVKWFMKNWHLWEDEPLPPRKNPEMSIPEFAQGLTNSLHLYTIHIQGQRVWTWIAKRNLPREDNFHVMSKIATGWQKDFALLVLFILADKKPVEQTDN